LFCGASRRSPACCALAASLALVPAAEARSTLSAGETLKPDKALSAGKTKLVMQRNGNLALYYLPLRQRSPYIKRLKHKPTKNCQTRYCKFLRPRQLWSSKTRGHPGAKASISSRGRLVVRQGRRVLWTSPSGNRSTAIERFAPADVEFRSIQLPGFQAPSNYEGSYYLAYFSQNNQGINYLQSVYFWGLYTWQVGLGANNQPTSGFVTDGGTFSASGQLSFDAGDDGGNQGPYTGKFNPSASSLAMNTPSISGVAQNGPFGVTAMAVSLYAQN